MKGVLLKSLSTPIHVNTRTDTLKKKSSQKWNKNWAVCTWTCQQAHIRYTHTYPTHTQTETHKQGNSERCHLCEERWGFFTLWVEVNLLFLSSVSQVGLNNTWPVVMGYHSASVCAFVCLCESGRWWCPQGPGLDAGRSTDSPPPLSGPISLS